MSEKFKNIVTVCGVAIFMFGFLLWGIIKPDETMSVSERRTLASMPKLSFETVVSGEFMENFESYTLDQFPLRDQFRTLKAICSFYIFQQKDNNDIYVIDGYASKLEYPINEDSLDYAAGRFQYIYDSLLADTDVNIYFSIVPDKNCFIAAENGYPSIEYQEFAQSMLQRLKFMDSKNFIDIYDLLELSDYYKTDIHWRQEKIVDVAEKLAAQMGVTFSSQYETHLLKYPFYGVYYGQSALPLPAEQIYYLSNETLENVTVFDYENSTEGDIYNMELAAGKDPYEMYLSGSRSLLTIENPEATTDKELIMFRDSFGSSLAPLLVEGYKKITLIDIRYLSSNYVGRFVEFENQDVLFIYSMPVLNNSVTMK
ncbi:MAG: DHHW family protein [Lachnospiraceae bacterium]